jgi:LacI family transcriptional regulator
MAEPVFKAPIIDIVHKIGVTSSTVSRALNDYATISDATKKAVIKTTKKSNYHPNKIASYLRLGTSKIIGVMIPSAETNFVGSVVNGIEKIASERDYNVFLYQSKKLLELEKKGLATFLRSRVDGLFASLSKRTTNFDYYKEVEVRGIPLRLFDRASDDLEVPSIVIDDYKGAFLAITHLVKQGCRYIAHIAGPQHTAIFKERFKGYMDALQQAGISYNKIWWLMD